MKAATRLHRTSTLSVRMQRTQTAKIAADPLTLIVYVGMVLYEVYSRKDPYEGEDPGVVLHAVADKDRNYRPPVPKACPPQLAGIMTDCFSADPEARPSFQELDQRLRRVDAEMAEPVQKSSMSSAKKTISLHDIFPAHIADAMNEGKNIEPEHK